MPRCAGTAVARYLSKAYRQPNLPIQIDDLDLMDATFRKATPGDHAGWVRLRFELWPECPVERHELEVAQLTASPGLVVLAEVGGALVGFAEVSIRTDHVEGTSITPVPYLEGWFVKAAYRGQGIGRGLMSFVEDWARSGGFSQLASDAELTNDPSIRLHQILGFSEVGRSVHFVKTLHRDGER